MCIFKSFEITYLLIYNEVRPFRLKHFCVLELQHFPPYLSVYIVANVYEKCLYHSFMVWPILSTHLFVCLSILLPAH